MPWYQGTYTAGTVPTGWIYYSGTATSASTTITPTTSTGTYTFTSNATLWWTDQTAPPRMVQQNNHMGYMAPAPRVRERHWLAEAQAEVVRAHTISAKTRARDLLLSHLSGEQQRALETEKAFIVIGASGRRYRIAEEEHLVANIEVLGANDNIEHRLCAHPELKAVPLGDHLLAQKLMIEFDEHRFLRLANRHTA